MSHAERFATDKWSVNGLHEALPLAVGRLIVLSIEEDRFWAALDAALLSGRADLATVLQRSASWKSGMRLTTRGIVLCHRETGGSNLAPIRLKFGRQCGNYSSLS